jgi:Restriction endonuclease
MKIDDRILNIQENVQQLSDKLLIEQTDFLAEHERGITILVLRHLREVELRRLFVDLKFSSMYAYCIKRLKFTENQTQTRLASARLLMDLPQIEKQIEDGRLNVTNLSKVQSFLKAEKSAQHGLKQEEKLALLAECENKPTRQVAKELIQKSHQPALLAEKFHMTEMVQNNKLVDQPFTKFEALLNEENSELLQEFKNLYAHELEDVANISVLNYLLKKAVAFKKKKLGIDTTIAPSCNSNNNAQPPMSPQVAQSSQVVTTNKTIKPSRKPLSVKVKRYVWKRANACCEHTDAKSGIRCNSKFALQPDHIIPIALGGTDEVTNLRLLCRSHNSRRAVKTFGVRR